MCNLYSQTRAREAVLRLFHVSDNRAPAFAPLQAIFPGHVAPVVRYAQDGDREIALLSWGFVLLQEGRVPRRLRPTSRWPAGSFPTRGGRKDWSALKP